MGPSNYTLGNIIVAFTFLSLSFCIDFQIELANANYKHIEHFTNIPHTSRAVRSQMQSPKSGKQNVKPLFRIDDRKHRPASPLDTMLLYRGYSLWVRPHLNGWIVHGRLPGAKLCTLSHKRGRTCIKWENRFNRIKKEPTPDPYGSRKGSHLGSSSSCVQGSAWLTGKGRSLPGNGTAGLTISNKQLYWCCSTLLA